MCSIIKNYNKLSSKRKKIIILIIILVLVMIWIFTRRFIAKRTIFNYINRQGISRNDIVVEDFRKDWKYGGYIYDVSVKNENPEIYYEYHCYQGKIMFSASEMNAKKIKEKVWGGNGLYGSDLYNLRYPPLKD